MLTVNSSLRNCNKCLRDQPLDQFYPSKKSKDGIDTWCKDCHFAKKLRRQYKLTPESYGAILDSQGGVCAICKTPPSSKRLSVDHDHSCCPGEVTCGKCVRGLLCDGCNWWLGLINDDLTRLTEAEQYLRRYPSCTASNAEVISTSIRRQYQEQSSIWRASFVAGAQQLMPRRTR